MTQTSSATLYQTASAVADTLPAATRVDTAADSFLINPWLGLIGLCVLVVTGAIAVIYEIHVEENQGF